MDKRATAIVIASAGLACAAANAQIVVDETCPIYAVDISSFATCDGEKVARPAAEIELEEVLLPEQLVAIGKRTSLGLYVDARSAYRLRGRARERIVLVDVRDEAEVARAGRTPITEVYAPYGDSGSLGALLRMLEQHEAGRDTVILLLSRSGERSAYVTEQLVYLGFQRVVNIVDGFEGDLNALGKRSLNGWKNAGLPWIDGVKIASRGDAG